MQGWVIVSVSVVVGLLVPLRVVVEESLVDARGSLWGDLRGDVEVPPGDPDGFGFAKIAIDPASGRLCFQLTLAGTDPPTAAHIHQAPPGLAGPVVVPLAAPADGLAKGCVDVDPALAAA